VSADGTLRLYHATSPAAAEQILTDGCLRLAEPDDVAERMLRRDRAPCSWRRRLRSVQTFEVAAPCSW